MSNEYTKEFGCSNDLFNNSVTINPKNINTGSFDVNDCIDCKNCVNCSKCNKCKNCIDCDRCTDCVNCVDCSDCVGLINKRSINGMKLY